ILLGRMAARSHRRSGGAPARGGRRGPRRSARGASGAAARDARRPRRRRRPPAVAGDVALAGRERPRAAGDAMTRLPAPQFPDPSAGPDDCAELIARWEAVLAKAPRLRAWLSDMIRQRRVLLAESGGGSMAGALWYELVLWV